MRIANGLMGFLTWLWIFGVHIRICFPRLNNRSVTLRLLLLISHLVRQPFVNDFPKVSGQDRFNLESEGIRFWFDLLANLEEHLARQFEAGDLFLLKFHTFGKFAN